jgi:hypothetical protein
MRVNASRSADSIIGRERGRPMPGLPGGSGGGGLCGLLDGGPARVLVDTARLIHIFGSALSGSTPEPLHAPLRRPGRPGLRAASPPRRAEAGMSAAGRHQAGAYVAGAEVETS